ncbi:MULTISPECIES: hypothetical protein [Mesorhizobium]|uniref:hypothetical protein n=1 Tax=Mesorhizobium TaxID=68287 RepID=UPI0007A936AA|nr:MULTISPECIES: hypothetical protein [Mesorhizobium]AMX93660.1 hypothetical protein A4R28_11400 [Mesorhizobium ciceri]MDF3208352.1 hypothetical protein [Mesorhizobium sp. LMG15046]MDF3229076.1 hypothetical protein [Mesorhizobium sp. DSM 30133]RUU22188.1 hypothetical protein EOC84_03490 [Mesorhizobium sp. Primo-B]RUU37902.1 hypothetical protein EOC83_16725 [Mesorhizobium sp. Primo-A]
MKRGDIVYTPAWCVSDMVRFFSPAGKILDPCRGQGAFTDFIPSAQWCEIDDGRDFFDFRDHVDWIIGNPPYSKTRQFMKHAFSISDNVVFLVPARNIVSGYGTVRECRNYGLSTKNIRWYGTGSKLGFPMGNAIAAFHWQRGDNSGQITETFYSEAAA